MNQEISEVPVAKQLEEVEETEEKIESTQYSLAADGTIEKEE